MTMTKQEINEQERGMINAIVWMLRREIKKLEGLQQVSMRNGNTERAAGHQDAIDLILETVFEAYNISDRDILQAMERAEAPVHPAVSACGAGGRKVD